jgi:hypothetical protein
MRSLCEELRFSADVDLEIISVLMKLNTEVTKESSQGDGIDAEEQGSKNRPLRNTTHELPGGRAHTIDSDCLTAMYKVGTKPLKYVTTDTE